ncbi:MAG: threonine aldolase family protein [Chromatiales bacterium]
MKQSTDRQRQFASDNYSGACPEVMAGLTQANADHTPSYGDDPWTERAHELFRKLFDSDCEVFLVHTGTAANALALASACGPHHGVICHASAHIQTDECGAPGFFTQGLRLMPLSAAHGKLTPALIEHAVAQRHDVHAGKPRVVSLTQATELGTVYRADEIAAIAESAQRHDLYVHMDGARFANAVAALDVPPRKLTVDAGVDVLCFGGTKNGMLSGEAVVFFNRELARDFHYRRKQAGQLASKMRFLAAQWIGLLENDLWLRNARHANRMAQTLKQRLASIPAARILYPCEANAVFVDLPANVCEGLHQRGWHFYNDVGPDGAARLMCSWDTRGEDIDALIADIKTLLSSEQVSRSL